MKQFQYTIWSTVVLCLIVSCKNQKLPSQEEATLKGSVVAILGETYQEIYNQDSTLSLCTVTTESSHPIITKFVICRMASEEIIFQSTVKDGFVRWHSESSLMIKDQPGIETIEDNNHLYIIDLTTNRKTAYSPKQNE